MQAALFRLLNHYPESGHNGATIKRLADDYFEDMIDEGVTLRQFERGISAARKTCRFFPKVFELLVLIREDRGRIDQRPTQNRIALPDQTTEHDLTPEEIEKNKKRIKVITDMLAKKLTIEEAEEMVKSPEVFSGRLFKSGN